MDCIGCGSAAVSERRERTAQGYRRFRCRACGKQFNERSAGSLNRTQYPSDVIALLVLWRLRYKLALRDLPEMFLIRGIVFTYEAVRDAGAGGIGNVSVALATNGPNKGVLFAVKVFSPDSSEKEHWKQAFMREVHVLRDCSHPAIVKVFDEGVLGDGRPFFVMKYLPSTLWEAMKAGRLDETGKVSIVMQLLSALDYRW